MFFGLIGHARNPWDMAGDIWGYLTRRVQVYDWSKQLPPGFYADGSLLAVTKNIGEARTLIYWHVYNLEFDHRAKSLPETEAKVLAKLEADTIMENTLSKEPDVYNLPFVHYRKQAD